MLLDHLEEMSTKAENSTAHLSDEIAISRYARFWLLFLLEIPSIICSLFVLYHLLFNRVLRHALHNHVFIIIIFINLTVKLTDGMWTLHYYRTNTVSSSTIGFCLLWMYVNYALYVATTMLVAWATIERHILIFHDRWVSNKTKRVSFHYLPLAILLLYCLGFHVVGIFFPPCENTFDFTQVICGRPLCFYNIREAALWDVVVHDLAPSMIIISFSLALLLRILYQKHRMRQPISWRKHRKMAIQLLSISLLYLVIRIPAMILEFVHACGVSEEFGADFTAYFGFYSYYEALLFPFVCAASLPNLGEKIRKAMLCWPQRRNVVAPEVVLISRMPDNRTARERTLVES